MRRFLHTKTCSILIHCRNKTPGQLLDRFVIFCGTFDDFIVYVRNVAHIVHLITRGPQPALHHIEHHHHPGMAQMTIVVDGHAADVHVDFARNYGREFLFFSRERIVYFQHISLFI